MKYLIFCLFLVSIILGINGCYEPIEGCLDTDATNYDVTADNSCPACCTLPALVLTMSYLFNGETFKATDTLLLSGDERVFIEDFHFWLTDINLIADGRVLKFEDSLRVFDSANQELWVQDNFRYFDRTSFRTELDGLRYVGEAEALSLKVGMTDIVNNYDIDSIIINSGLTRIPNGSYSPSQQFIFLQMSLSSPDGQIQNIEIVNRYPLPEIKIPLLEVELSRAEDISMGINIDFAELLKGVSLSQIADTNQSIIWQNLKNSFFQTR